MVKLELLGDKSMAHSIQSIRSVYDLAKCARDSGKPFDDEEIKKLLERTVTDEKLISEYSRFHKGYAAEDLFMRIFSLLPWVRSVVPLGQEQFPENSKETIQVPDYEIIFEAGNETDTATILVEVKLVDGDKQTFELQKYKYEVLHEYSSHKKVTLLFAMFWRRQWMWTINSIESFIEKSSSYKISYERACANDLSAILGDYTYLFRKQCYRKSIFSKNEKADTEFVHRHEEYGKTIYEGLSLDEQKFESLCMFEPALLDCAFDFKEISYKKLSNTEIEIIEQYDYLPYVYKLSSLLLAYLNKMYCIDKDNMYYKDNILVKRSFDIVDTIRRKCGGEKFYLIPYNVNETSTQLFNLQFGKVKHIFDAYKSTERNEGHNILVSHE